MDSIKAPALPPLLPFAGRSPERPTPAPFQGLAVASSGLSLQRLRMEVTAANLANAETTRTADGGPYQRQVVTAEPTPAFAVASQAFGDYAPSAGGVRATGIATDTSEGALVYDPSHPDADRAGYVRMPNVDPTTELVTMMEARRLYEANATVFAATKSMLRRAIDI
ncbi:MAG: flagellar basal body rod protein FlgC [Gemmatimonadales bacterium]|nr:flagellar basal body rod protein FlgC [Gemmatimonadales bacterium]